MYQITCDNQILYDIRSRDRIVTSPKLILEIGKNGSLSFRIPRTNPMRDKINLKKSIFKVFQIVFNLICYLLLTLSIITDYTQNASGKNV